MGRHVLERDTIKLCASRPSDESVKRQILSKVGKRVKFKYPGDEGELRGVLRERVVIESDPGPLNIPYWDVVDLIEFPGAPKPLWMRVGYYRFALDWLPVWLMAIAPWAVERWRRYFTLGCLAWSGLYFNILWQAYP